jgi:hypothetical protein
MPLNLPYLPFKYVGDKKLYKNIKYPKIPIREGDVYVTATFGDRLDLLADRFYRDTKLWWVINYANPTKLNRDSLFIKPGTQLRIPTNIPAIIQEFEEINT